MDNFVTSLLVATTYSILVVYSLIVLFLCSICLASVLCLILIYILREGAEVGLCTSSWERLGTYWLEQSQRRDAWESHRCRDWSVGGDGRKRGRRKTAGHHQRDLELLLRLLPSRPSKRGRLTPGGYQNLS